MSDTEQQQQQQQTNATTENTTPRSTSSAAKAAEEGKRVYVGNIPFRTSYAELRELFQGFDM